MAGSVMVILSPLGRVVAVVKATVTAAVVTCIGFLSADAKLIDTKETAKTDEPPRAGVGGATASCKSEDVATLYEAAA